MKPLAGWTRTAAVGAVLLAVSALGACGDSDDHSSKDGGSGGGDASGPPADASVEEFCAIVNDTGWAADVDTADSEAVVTALQGWGDELAAVGTPEDIPDDAREGYELSLQQIEDLEPADVDEAEERGSLDSELSGDEKEQVDAFTEWESETCAATQPQPEAPGSS